MICKYLFPFGRHRFVLSISFAVQKFLVWYSSLCLFLFWFPLPKERYPERLIRVMLKGKPPLFFLGVLWFQVLYSTLIHFDLLAEREVRKTIPFMIATAKTKISRNKFNQEGKTCTLKNISHFWMKVKKHQEMERYFMLMSWKNYHW